MMIKGYASDSFGYLVPYKIRTQIVCIVATISGLFLISFLIGKLSLSISVAVVISQSINHHHLLHHQITK